MTPSMTEDDVVALLDLLTAHGIPVHVDGGWAVDALLGRQTRPHKDLDLAVDARHVAQLRAVLAQHGFREIPRDDAWECNFVLADDRGREIDVHVYGFDEEGRWIYGLGYPPTSLTGRGVIGGREVACIEPGWLVRFHTGYPLDEDDVHDVRLLGAHFGLPLPAEYRNL